MTPKEKAEELVEKFKFETKRSEIINDILLGDISVIFKHYKAKQCALMAVDEVLWEIIKYADNSKEYVTENAKFWNEVKQEIEKL